MFSNYREIAANDAKNTSKAAGVTEVIDINTGETASIRDFNSLMVTNLDSVNIEVQLDAVTGLGRIFPVPAGAVLMIQPYEGIVFNQLRHKNLDSAVATTADKITFRWAKSVKEL